MFMKETGKIGFIVKSQKGGKLFDGLRGIPVRAALPE
jgi:hypothetical protein